MKTHNIFKCGLLIAITFSFVSCNFTDIEPTDQIGDKAIFSSSSSLEQAVTGTYSSMSMRNIISISAVLSDDVIKGGQNGGAGDDTFSWTYTSSIGDHSNLWIRQYSVINMANRILADADNVSANSEADRISINNSIATAKVLRAYNALELLLFFSDIDKPDTYGIPYTLKPVILEKPKRNTVEECFNLMLKDLEEAKPMLKQDMPDNTAYVSKLAVDALRARIYLYMKRYDEAYKYANDVLMRKPIAKRNIYKNIWIDESNEEVIWKLKRGVGEETIGTIFWSADNSSSYEPSVELINSYDKGDIRLKEFIGKGVDRDNVPVNRVNKYKGTPSNVGLADEKLLRSSEMLLIKAEAAAHSNLQEANELLNSLRKERIVNWVPEKYDSFDEFMAQILLERRRELCYEGHRFFDMRRFKKDIVKPTLKNKTLEIGNYRWVLPIPLAEIQGNSELAKQQNPGY